MPPVYGQAPVPLAKAKFVGLVPVRLKSFPEMVKGAVPLLDNTATASDEVTLC